MMIKLKQTLVGLCLGLLFFPLAGYAQATAGVSTVASNQQSEEERARQYFTDTEVIDQNGNKLRFYSDVLKGRVVLISFIFTNCEYACPMQAQKLKQTRALMVPAIKDEVWFVTLSVDPERDTPEAMKQFAEKQGVDESRWIFLTGEKKNLEFLVKKLGQYTPDVEAHTTLMLAGNDLTQHWTRVLPMVPPDGIAQQLRSLVEETPG
jgi:cytochrome oxidase Cu insertion factor (SCO1/SenC/PrrC family)